MSVTSSTSAVTFGGCYYKPPFTAVQWQELELQAMVYKYFLAGLPVPPDLLLPIRRSFEAFASRFYGNPALAYCSYYGKKFDPEPGRCRRTDGKKWRCSKVAYADSKYCERHMHRGRNRSRKPVESYSTSQSLSSAMSHVSGGSNSSGIFQSSASVQNVPLYSAGNSDTLYSESSLTKLQIEPGLYGNNNKEYRYIQGYSPDADPGNFSSEVSGSMRSLGVGSDMGSTWHLHTSQVSSIPLQRSKHDQQLLGLSSEKAPDHSLDPLVVAGLSKKREQQSCLFGNEIGSHWPVKQEKHAMRPFFDEWPSTKEAWSNLDEVGSEKSRISETQLSISIPLAPSEFSDGNACSPNGI